MGDWSANYCDILEIRSRSHPRSSASIAGNDWSTCETSIDTSRANGLDKEYRIEYFALSNSKVTSFSDTISSRDHANDDCSLNSRVCRHVVVVILFHPSLLFNIHRVRCTELISIITPVTMQLI